MKRLTPFLVLIAALAIAAPAGAARPKAGTFKGKTAQKRKLTVVVKSNEIKSIEYSTSCNSKTLVVFTTIKLKIKKSGKFSHSFDGASQLFSFKGKFTKGNRAKRTKDRAKGTLRFHDKLDDCDTGKVSFSVKRR